MRETCIHIYIYIYGFCELKVHRRHPVRRRSAWSRTNGVNTNGATAKGMHFDRMGKKVRPGTFGEIKVGQREYPKSPSVKKHEIRSDTTSADPICPFPIRLPRCGRPSVVDYRETILGLTAIGNEILSLLMMFYGNIQYSQLLRLLDGLCSAFESTRGLRPGRAAIAGGPAWRCAWQ